MILYLTFAAWCFAHLDDIAAKFVGWLCTPFSYGGRHRTGWRELSSDEWGSRAIAGQRQAVAKYREWLEWEARRPKALTAVLEPTPLCPPMYATLAEHGKPKTPPIDYSAYTDHKVTAPALPRRYVLGLTQEEPIPVAHIGGELVEVT